MAGVQARHVPANFENRQTRLSIDGDKFNSVDKRRRLRHDNRFDPRDKQHCVANNATDYNNHGRIVDLFGDKLARARDFLLD